MFRVVQGTVSDLAFKSYLISSEHVPPTIPLLGDGTTGTPWVGGAGVVGADTARMTLAQDDLLHSKLNGFNASATFNVAASAPHVAGDVVGAAASTAAQQFSNIGNSGKIINITRAKLTIASATAHATAWRLECYGVTPPSALLNDAPWLYATGDIASHLCTIPIPPTTNRTSGGVGNQVAEIDFSKDVKLAGTGLFAYLICESGLTIATVGITVDLTCRAVS